MFTRGVVGRTRGDLRTRATYDLLPALAIAAVAAVDTFQWTGGQQPTNSQRWSYLAISVLAVIGMLFRRRAPLVVVVTLAIVVRAWGFIFFPLGAGQIPFAPVLIMPVLAYNTGTHTRGWRALVGDAVLVLFVASGFLTLLRGEQLGNQLPFAVIMVVAWLIGKGTQRYRDLTTSLRAQAIQLEQEREERARLAVALERARIARELHDVIAHSVSVMVVQAAAERKVLGQERQETRDVLDMIERTGRQALVELRRMLGVLRKTDDPLLLAPQPRLADLDSLLDQVREAGLPVVLRVEGSRVPLPAGVELSAYRIVQEALTNTLKHAGRAHAEVTLRYLADSLELDVLNDSGDSSARPASNGGHGLAGMRERVAMLGGSLHAGPRQSGGFLVAASLPLER
jgi:signal transduction histidine kinase